jgi:predicted membrane channel-forming protein YqfA (hemolysin III family)
VGCPHIPETTIHGAKENSTHEPYRHFQKIRAFKDHIFYSHREELWNSWSHAGGIALGVVFGVIFLVWCFREHNGWATLGVSLYLFGMPGRMSPAPPTMP